MNANLPNFETLISRLRFRHLKLIIALDKYKTVQRAAQEVALTQPGATKALNEIEDLFGHLLFIRTHRGIEPTQLGLCVVRYARIIFNEINHLRSSMAGVVSGQGGNLSIGIIMGSVSLITQVITDIYQDQKEVSVEITEDTSRVLLSLLEKRILDVVIGRVKASPRPYLFNSIPIHNETLYVVSHPKHPLAQEKKLKLCDLQSSKWVFYPADMPMRMLLEREFHENALDLPIDPIETSSAFTTITIMQSDHRFVALMSKDAAMPFIYSGMIKRLPLEIQSRSEEYELIALKGASLEP